MDPELIRQLLLSSGGLPFPGLSVDQEPGTPIAALSDGLAAERIAGRQPGVDLQRIAEASAIPGPGGVPSPTPQPTQQSDAPPVPKAPGPVELQRGTQDAATPSFAPDDPRIQGPLSFAAPRDKDSQALSPSAAPGNPKSFGGFFDLISRLTSGPSIAGLRPSDELRARYDGMIAAGMNMIAAGQPGSGMTTAGAVVMGLMAGQKAGQEARMRYQMGSGAIDLSSRDAAQRSYQNALGLGNVDLATEIRQFMDQRTLGQDQQLVDNWGVVAEGNRTASPFVFSDGGTTYLMDRNNPDAGFVEIPNQPTPYQQAQLEAADIYIPAPKDSDTHLTAYSRKSGDVLWANPRTVTPDIQTRAMGDKLISYFADPHTGELNVLSEVPFEEGPTAQDRVSLIRDYNNVFNRYYVQGNALTDLLRVYNNPDANAAQRHAAVFQFLEILDPESVKRESEVAAIGDLSPRLEWFLQQARRWKDGGNITDKVANQLGEYAFELAPHLMAVFNAQTSVYREAGAEYGIAPEQFADPFAQARLELEAADARRFNF